MNKFEIVSGSLKISKDGVVLLLTPKSSCAIEILNLSLTVNPKVVIFNKYLANFTPIFSQPLNSCVDSTNTVFTYSSFLAFTELNLGF